MLNQRLVDVDRLHIMCIDRVERASARRRQFVLCLYAADTCLPDQHGALAERCISEGPVPEVLAQHRYNVPCYLARTLHVYAMRRPQTQSPN